MMSRILPSLLSVLSSASLLSADAIEAPITDVTVFPDRAVITRAGSTSTSDGISEITVTGLPENLLPDSLQVTARAEAELTILDVQSATRFAPPEGMDRLKPLLEKQEQLERNIDEIDLTLTALRQQQAFLGKIENSVTVERAEGDVPSPEEWTGLIEFFQDSLQDLLPRIYEQEKNREELKEELEAVNNEIEQTRGAERTRTREATVRFEAEEATDAEFTLSYTMMNAGWSPAYNIRVRSSDKEIDLDYRANVRQQTGEDWSDVTLTLSTARPSLGGTPPEMQPWRVAVRQPVPEARAERDLSFSGLEPSLAESAPQKQAQFQAADVESSLTAVNMRVPARATVPADGEPHQVGVDNFPLDGEFFYTLVPKLSPHAFLQARVTHPGPAPILAGRANIFLDGNLVGHSNLPRVEPDQEFELPLGVDEAISVERELLRRFVEQRGLISKTTRTRFEFETTITNRRATTEKLVVKDQVPVSQDERIEIDLIELSGGKRAEEDPPGFYKWELTLEPGAEAKIPLTFTVEHPEDVKITGL